MRYAINFVPAVAPVIASSPVDASSPVVIPIIPSIAVTDVAGISSPVVPSSVSSTDFSVFSSANFVPASAFTLSSCIGTTQ